MALEEHDIVQPWPVQLLVAWLIGSGLWSLVGGDEKLVGRVVFFAIAALVARAMWNGARWAFTTWFMLASLCAVLTGGIVFVQIFLLEQGATPGIVWGFLIAVIDLALLLHPQTRAFAESSSRYELTQERA